MQRPGAVTDAETWKKSLDKCRYPVDLRKFRSGTKHRGWFESSISPGDRRQTRDFEARFRKLAPYHLEAWAEVAFWKLYSRRGIARENALKVLRSAISPRTLWCSCNDYIEDPSIESFRGLRSLLFDTRSVATAATFPAFICPEKFPMVDTQVTKWVRDNGHLHTYAEVGGPGLEEVPVLKTGSSSPGESLGVHQVLDLLVSVHRVYPETTYGNTSGALATRRWQSSRHSGAGCR